MRRGAVAALAGAGAVSDLLAELSSAPATVAA
jgi:hypothetical protein